MVWLANSGEGGTEDAAVTTGNSGGASGNAWDTVSNNTVTFDNAHARAGRSYKFVNSTQPLLQWNSSLTGSTLAQVWGRAYIYLESNHASGSHLGIVRVLNAGSQVTRIAVRSTGQIDLRNAANITIATSTGSITTGQWNRIEWYCLALSSGGAITVRLYQDADSSTITETVSATGAALLTNLTAVEPACALSVVHTYWADDLAVTTTGWPGPLVRGRAGHSVSQAVSRAARI